MLSLLAIEFVSGHVTKIPPPAAISNKNLANATVRRSAGAPVNVAIPAFTKVLASLCYPSIIADVQPS